MVIVSLTEPTVIQYHQLYAYLGSLLGNGSNLILIEIKISSFPVVEQNRTLLITESAATDTLHDKFMINVAHLAKTFVRVYHYTLRCLEGLTGI